MKIDYLQQREQFDETLLQTLAAGWSEQYGHDVHVTSAGAATHGWPWMLHPLFNVYYGPVPDKRVRRFLRNHFRHNTRRRRAAQAFLASALTLPAALRLAGREAFHVTGGPHSTARLLILPGNNRVRVFDFDTGLCRVFLKQGFCNATIRREVEVRSRGDGPFPRLDAWSPRFDWFEERILDAIPISRCPSATLRARAEVRTFDLLEEWLATTTRSVSSSTRVDTLLKKIRQDVAVLRQHFGTQLLDGISCWSNQLARHAEVLESIQLAEVHGDLILSNILVTASEDVYLIDWERSEERFCWYDHFVYGLRSRYIEGLAGRVLQFARNGGEDSVLGRIPISRRWRLAATALFLLEDLSFQLYVNAASPYLRITDELQGFLSELNDLQPYFGRTDS